jgi:DNA-binding transcriptional LysR family regulator
MIDFRRLSYLVVLAKRLSYSHAALELGLSQSALSRAIQSLEREIDMRLFDRDQSGVRLTEQGQWVVAKAEVLLTNATDFANQLAFAAKGVEGRIRFGMTAMPAHLLLAALLPQRLAGAPRFTHEVLIRDSGSLYLMLAQGQIEFLICTELSSIWSIPEVMPVKTERLGSLPIGLVVRKGHPLLDESSGESRFPILVADAASLSGQLTSTLRDQMGTNVQVIEDIGLIASTVLETDALWLTCPHIIDRAPHRKKYSTIPMPPNTAPTTFEIYAYSLERRTMSPTAINLLDEFKTYISRNAI